MIGPDIPAYLAQLKSTTPEEEDAPEAGPSVGPSVGPVIPAHLLSTSTTSSTPQPEEEEEEEDDYVPALPPDLLAARSASAPIAKLQGPALPPHLARRREEESEDDDDDYGPKPLPAGFVVEEKSAVKQFMEREERRRKLLEEASKPKTLQRDEWMLVPPSSSDLLSTIDPTKLNKPRQFARTAAPARAVDTSLWTETPAERQQRLADEIAGKRRRAEDQEVDVAERGKDGDEVQERERKRRRDEEIRAGVDEHTRKNRGAALVQQHKSKDQDQDPAEGPPALWDHTRDMGLGGRLMDDKSREKMIKDARGLGDRFGTGKSGGFL